MARMANEEDIIPTANVGHDFKMAMQKARVAAGMSQKQLA
jgi:ribosome-binding protein aMBF1 (putative translation factor)